MALKKKQTLFKKIQNIFKGGSNGNGEGLSDTGGLAPFNESDGESDGVHDFVSFVLEQELNDIELDNTWSLEQNQNVAQNDFLYKANYMINQYSEKQLQDNGNPALLPAGLIDYSEPFWEDDFPDNMAPPAGDIVSAGGFTGEYGEKPSENDRWHQEVGGPLINSLLQDTKILLENSWLQQNSLNGKRLTACNTLILACEEYLNTLEGFSFTTKVDTGAPPTNSTTAGPLPTDASLPNNVVGELFTHYIAYSSTPLRLAPTLDPDDSVRDWDDTNFTYVSTIASTSSKDEIRITIPQGTGIIVTEIVEGRSGQWVGFVLDPATTNERPNTAYYTRPEFIRKLSGSPTDPLVSAPVNISAEDFVSSALSRGESNLPPGLKDFSPKDNDNWLFLFPDEVVLSEYNFIEHAQSDNAQEYGINPLNLEDDMLPFRYQRYSQGHFYFILAEIERSDTTINTLEQARETAWANLLKYFDKDKASEGLENLKEQYFVPVVYRVNTNSTGPNQKILFAIRASYIDSLPNSKLPFADNFDQNDDNEKEFIGGRNYSVTFRVSEVKQICMDLKNRIKDIKGKIEKSDKSIKILGSNDQPWNADIIANYLLSDDSSDGTAGSGDFPTLLADLLDRQVFPRTTKNDYISTTIKQAANIIRAGSTTDGANHLIQIGIRDNGVIGPGVRETVSYVLFSPDPDSLKDDQNSHFNLFYFDPHITQPELERGIQRSAIVMRTGLSNFRTNFEGTYGSMVLHYLLSHMKLKKGFKDLAAATDKKSNQWSELLLNYTVPPVKIDKDSPPASDQPGEEGGMTLEEILAELAKSSPVHGRRQIELREMLLAKKQEFFEAHNEAIPATDPEVSKKNLEKKSKELDNLDSAGKSIEGQIPWPVRYIYEGIYNSLDVEAIIALIMACIQSKLGIPLTAEALCEAAIIEIIQTLGIDQTQSVLLGLASEDPSKYSDFIESEEPVPGSSISEDIDYTFSQAPIATYMAMDPNADPAVTAVIKGLEMGGTTVNLVPGPRPQELINDSGQGIVFNFPDVPDNIAESMIDTVYGKDVQVNPFYTWPEIEDQRDYYHTIGFNSQQARAKLVQDGYLIPDEQQYGPLLSGDGVLDQLQAASDQLANRLNKAGVDSTLASNIGATFQDADNYLTYLKSLMSLQDLCELLAGNLLDGLDDLLRDPLGFINGGAGNWFDSFIEELKRKFSFPVPTFKFPDNLKTDSHMGSYGEKLLEAVLTLVVSVSAQILNLVIKDALLKCIEEGDTDLGPANDPNIGAPPTIPIPNLPAVLNRPGVTGQLPATIALPLVEELIDNISLGQLCALLKGEASRQTLYNISLKIKSKEDSLIDDYIILLKAEPYRYEQAEASNIARRAVRSSIRTMGEIENMFRAIGQSGNFDICNFLSPTQTILDDVCIAFYDRKGKSLELQEAGLSEQEAESQIDRDLTNLKNKVIGLAPSLFPGRNGIGDIIPQPPDPCEGGYFQVPPGVQNAMSLITDNLLSNVKGSLIQDMTALKFFATPPRAVMALKDPSKLKETYDMFTKAATRPFQKECVAFIGNPDLFPNQSIENIAAYPLVYGVADLGYHRHAGQFDGSITIESPSILFPEEQAEKLREYYAERGIEYRMEQDYFRPTSFIPMLNSFRTEADNTDPLFPLSEPVYALFDGQQKIPILKDLLKSFIPDQEVSDSEKKRLLSNALEEIYGEDVKPKYLAETVMEAKHLQTPALNSIRLQSGEVDLEDVIQAQQAIKYPLLIQQQDQMEYFGLIARPYSIHTRLRDIWGPSIGEDAGDDDVYPWYQMFNAYITGKRLGQGANVDLYFEDPARIKTEEHIPLIINPKDEWKENGVVNKGILDDPSTWKEDYEEGSDSLPFGHLDFNTLLAKIDNIPGFSTLLPPLTSLWRNELDGSNSTMWLQGFLDLTLGEAIGFTDERVKALFPNFPGTGNASIMLGITTDEYGDFSFIPAYAVFKQTYVDPQSPLAASQDDMVSYFSADTDAVNTELFEYLSDDEVFPQVLGYDNGPLQGFESDHINAFLRLYNQRNLNPNVIRYELPTSEVNTAIDMETVLNYPLNSNYESVIQAQNLLQSNNEFINRKHSLLYQNMLGAKRGDVVSAVSSFADTYRAMKAKLSKGDNREIPPNPLVGFESAEDVVFDLAASHPVSDDIQQLVSSLYGGSTAPMLSATERYETIKQYYNLKLIQTDKTLSNLSDKPGHLNVDPTNFKAQVFGRLLTSKFFSKIEDYLDFESEEAATEAGFTSASERREYLRNQMEAILTSHGFSSLQYAYSNQIFSKLKRSRLQERGFMKKLWNKMLVNTLSDNNSGIHPECRNLFDNLSLQTSDEIENIETDFFKVDEVKQEIMNFYKKMLCRDVYEKSGPDENAVKDALTHGIIKLLIKVYCLEMCIASVISWDSYDLGDVFESDIMVSTIINNINTDDTMQDAGLSFGEIYMHALEIVRKDNNLQDNVELAEFLNGTSPVAYMIADAGRKITSIVSSLFQGVNYQPISTDLQFEVLKNSDPNFITDYKRKVLANYNLNTLPDNLNPERYKKLYDVGNIEYTLDARFNQNVYTMNYGSGNPQDLIAGTLNDSVGYDGFDIDQVLPNNNNTPDLCKKYINIYGFNNRDNIIKNKKSKNFLHSVPYNFYQAEGWPGQALDSPSQKISYHSEEYSRTLLDKDSDHRPGGVPIEDYDYNVIQHAYRALGNFAASSSYYGLNDKIYEDTSYNTEYARFIKMNDLARKQLGGSDAYNKEMHQHLQYGNIFNGMFGNIVFEPYVKIEDYTEEDLLSEEYASQLNLTYYVEKSESQPTIEPCKNPFQIFEVKINNLDVSGFLSDLNKYRQEDNIHNSYIFDCVPLPVWSHFYNEIFLEKLNREQNSELKDFFNIYGLTPFFKNIKFGLRMSYVSAVSGEDQYSVVSDDAKENYLIKNFMKDTFMPGKRNYPGVDEVSAWGLKSSKTFYNQRPYYYGDADMLANKRFKICNELHIPIVELEREINFIEGQAAFSIEGDSSNTIFSLDKLGVFSADTYDILGGIENLFVPPSGASLPDDYTSPASSTPPGPFSESEVDKVVAGSEYQSIINIVNSNVPENEQYMKDLAKYYAEIFKNAINPPSMNNLGVIGWEVDPGDPFWKNIASVLINNPDTFGNLNITTATGELNAAWVDPAHPLGANDDTYKTLSNRITAIDWFLQGGYEIWAGDGNILGNLTETQLQIAKLHPDFVTAEQQAEDNNTAATFLYKDKIISGYNYPGYYTVVINPETGAPYPGVGATIRAQSFNWMLLAVEENLPAISSANTGLKSPLAHPDGGLQPALVTNNFKDYILEDGQPNDSLVGPGGSVTLSTHKYFKVWYNIARAISYNSPDNVVVATGPIFAKGYEIYNGLDRFVTPVDEEVEEIIFEAPEASDEASPLPQPPYLPNLSSDVSNIVQELLDTENAEAIKHITNNFHQFFYGNLAQDMIDEMKQTPEFRLLFEHLFPIKRYMALGFMMGSDSLSKYIKEPTDVLDITKGRIFQIVDILKNSSNDYTFLPGVVGNFEIDEIQGSEFDTAAAQPDLSKQIEMIILRTSYLILKGFVEVTDPAVIIAKTIIDVANAAQQAIVAGIETGIRTAKDVANATKQAAQAAMKQIESQVILATIPIETSINIIGEIPFNAAGNKLSSLIVFETSDAEITNWNISASPLPDGASDFLDSDQIDTYNNIRDSIESMTDLLSDYNNAKNDFNNVDTELKGALKTLEEELEEAKKIMRDIFQSPYLLPGLWAAMIPSMMPFLGGVVPPPFPGGPPSTIPGMIYIAILFLDAYEESQHQKYTDLNDVNCEDEL